MHVCVCMHICVYVHIYIRGRERWRHRPVIHVCVCVCTLAQTYAYYIMYIQASADEMKAEGAVKAGILKGILSTKTPPSLPTRGTPGKLHLRDESRGTTPGLGFRV